LLVDDDKNEARVEVGTVEELVEVEASSSDGPIATVRTSSDDRAPSMVQTGLGCPVHLEL
jgi:hypothetical protein